MGKQRKLTAGEISLARAAFGKKVDYGKVRLTEGPGNNVAAKIAFAKGNPAITIGSTVYFKRDFCDDFAAAGRNRKSFMHEMTHVWQYQKLGMAKFLLRYGEEFIEVGGKPSDMYKYKKGETKFGEAMLEAQANMIGDYSEAVWKPDEARRVELARNLAGSGLYGL